MTRQDAAAADLERASERWLAWLASETTRRPDPSGSALSALWDALEAWFASDDFASSVLAAAMVAPPDGRGPAAHAVLIRHRQATRRLLEDMARSSGARDPEILAGQLLTLVEGAMAGALVDRHPGVARHARDLTRIALAAAATHG
jgi:AcrR family transcriptional regulator